MNVGTNFTENSVEPAMNLDNSQAGGALGIMEYLQIARRRAAVILLTAMAVTVVVMIVVKRMPSLYRAETTVLVDPQEVPSNLVTPIITSSVSDRLSTIHQEVTSPTRLQVLIHSMNLYSDLRKTASEQQIIAEMQKSITVQVSESGGRGMSTFKVGFSGKDPQEVARVANQLADQFIDENLKLRATQSEATAQFFELRQQEVKQKLEEKESELNTLRAKYILELPESQQFHVEALAGLRNQLLASQDRVNRAQQEKVYLQTLMSTQAPTVDLDSAAGAGQGSGGASPEVQKLQNLLTGLRARYGENHPEVKKIEAELKEATSKKSDEQTTVELPAPTIHDAPSARKSGKNPVLTAQIENLDQEIAKAKLEQQDLQQKIASHEQALEGMPLIEEKIAEITRDSDALQASYKALENRKLDADTAKDLETQEKGERFHILDRAVPPSQAYAPKRAMMSLAGLAAGLALGIGLAVLLEIRQGAVHSKADVQRLVGEIPILATIPTIRAGKEVAMQRLRIAGAFMVTAVGSVVAGVAISYLMNRK